MRESFIINKTISSLKNRLESNNNLIILQLEEGYITEATCTFHEPVSEENLLDFSERKGYQLPDDYVAFLKITNGCRLFDPPY